MPDWVLAVFGWLDLATLAMVYALAAAGVALVQWRDVRAWVRQRALPALHPVYAPWRHDDLADFWRFLRAGFFTGSLSAMVKNADILILGHWRPAQEVGWYRLAKSLAGTLQAAAGVLSQTIFQDVSEWVERRQAHHALVMLQASTRKLLLPFLAVYLVAGAALWWLLPWVYGRAFEPSRVLVLCLLLGTFVSSILFWVNPLLLALERFRAYVTILLATTCVTLVAQVALTPRYGAVGTALAVALAWAVGHGAIFLYLRMSIGVKPS